MSIVCRNMVWPCRVGEMGGADCNRQMVAARAGPRSRGGLNRPIGSEKPFDHRIPGLSKVRAVVAAAAEAEHSTVAEAVGQRGEIARGSAMRRRAEAEVGDGVAFQAVGTA